MVYGKVLTLDGNMTKPWVYQHYARLLANGLLATFLETHGVLKMSWLPLPRRKFVIMHYCKKVCINCLNMSFQTKTRQRLTRHACKGDEFDKDFFGS